MQCLHPIKVRRYLDEDKTVCERVEVPCGKCAACQMNARQQWVQRLVYEFKAAKTAAFVTLTYDDEHLYINENGVPSVNKRDVQLFMKRLRKEFGSGLRFFLMSEYGDDPRYTQRPHYHMLLFNYPPMDFLRLAVKINEIWKKTDKYFNLNKVVEPINGNRIGYVAGYGITRKMGPYGSDPNFMLCSRRPAIGSCYLTPARLKYHYETGNLSVKTDTGSYPLHRYFRDKISDDDFKERASENYQQYQAKRNFKEFGFEDFELNWNTEQIAEHGLSQEQYELLCNNELERRKAWEASFYKKQKHKHIKV